MTVVAVGSVTASPGATTTVLALGAVWPANRRVLVVEADPDGGVLAARCGLRLDPGVSTLAAAWRHSLDPTALERHTQQLAGGVPAIIAPADPNQATRALEVVAPRLGEIVGKLDTDVLIDVGRLRASSPVAPLAEAADTLLVASRPRLDELQAVAPRARSLRRSELNVALLLIGDRPYPADEVATALGLQVLGAVAEDRAAAGMLAGHGGSEPRLRRSLLLRSVRDLLPPLLAGEREPAPHAADATVDGPRPASPGGRFTAREPMDARSSP